MEKRKAHYSLSLIRALITQGRYHITATAVKSAYEDFSLTTGEILDYILILLPSDLYKSMTSRYDPTLWQDVYHKKVGALTAYIKLQILDDETVIISFKEK